MSNLLYHDNKDDRGQFYNLLNDPVMNDGSRFYFVRHCLLSAPNRMHFQLVPIIGGLYNAMIAKTDLLAIVSQCRLDMTKTLNELVQFVRCIPKRKATWESLLMAGPVLKPVNFSNIVLLKGLTPHHSPEKPILF